MCANLHDMINHVVFLAAIVATATPAFAIQEVVLGPRSPSFAAAASMGLGWEALPMPSRGSVGFSDNQLARDPRQWAFSGGETVKMGSFLFNTSSGPSWTMASPMGFGSGFSSAFTSAFPGSFGGMGDLGWTTRTTAGVMAADNLMFYTSVGQTTFRGGSSSIIPVAPGLSLLEQPSNRTDMRAGFKMELMPGLTFGVEAAFAPTQAR